MENLLYTNPVLPPIHGGAYEKTFYYEPIVKAMFVWFFIIIKLLMIVSIICLTAYAVYRLLKYLHLKNEEKLNLLRDTNSKITEIRNYLRDEKFFKEYDFYGTKKIRKKHKKSKH